MRNVYKLLAFAAAFIPSSVLAQAAEQRFTRAGVTYVYTVTPAAHGRRVIEGHSQPGGSRFSLVVAGDHVHGVSGGQTVSFRAPRPTAVKLAAN